MKKAGSEALVSREDEFDDHLSLLDLVAFLRRNFRVLLGGALLGGALGFAIALIVPAQWEANALVRVGQLGNTGNTGSTGSTGSAIEPSLQAVDRIKNKSFQNDVLKNLGLPTSADDDVAKNFRDTLKVKLEKSDLIGLSIRGASADEAKQYMSEVVNQLKNTHSKMSTPSINRWRQELATIEQELKQASAESERLTKSLNGTSGSLDEKSFSQSALLSNILLARETELKNSRERKRELEAQLSPERTFATKELGRVEVSERPVFPKKSLFVIAGLVAGLFLGSLLSILRSIGLSMRESIKLE